MALRTMALGIPLAPCASPRGVTSRRPSSAATVKRSSLKAQNFLSGASLQKSREAEARQARGQVAVRAVTDTFWVTARSAVAVVLGLAGSGVVVGLLLQYKCWRDAVAQVEQLVEEGKSLEELAALAVEELKEQGVQVRVEDAEPGMPSELNGATLEVGQQEEGAADVPVSAGASVPVTAAVGRRRRPQQTE